MTDDVRRTPQLMEQDAAEGHNVLVDVPCVVCGKSHIVLVAEKNRAQWKRAVLTRCPDAEEADDDP